ncbi:MULTISPECIES: DUF397 domain-containing protein [unclassified Streptomyces]|uniref:DUF397 domain-containing protein n=1 Tax=unclassified Streptomyces TaxID=2593676 RepID=UPI00081E001C|nr:MULTISPECIES: DUF397 domain-containing protein [unclassified Streptomyces]MYR95490.1 DUF397 domain-containing protein [Streptomyces sp. SID4937]SCD91447.1 protein of unknown function [Streptomyces sp. ScaeMP-e83]
MSEFDGLWVKSSYSNTDGGNCVEWAPSVAGTGVVPVRDSKTPDGPSLAVSRAAWAGLVEYAKAATL